MSEALKELGEALKESVKRDGQRDLVRRVREKMRKQYGGDEGPEDALPGPADMPRPLQVLTGDIPQGILKRIDRLAQVDADRYTFVVSLSINGAEFPIEFTLTAHALVALRHHKAAEVILHKTINRSIAAVTQKLKEGLVQDVTQVIENQDWDRVDGMGLFPFGR